MNNTLMMISFGYNSIFLNSITINSNLAFLTYISYIEMCLIYTWLFIDLYEYYFHKGSRFQAITAKIYVFLWILNMFVFYFSFKNPKSCSLLYTLILLWKKRVLIDIIHFEYLKSYFRDLNWLFVSQNLDRAQIYYNLCRKYKLFFNLHPLTDMFHPFCGKFLIFNFPHNRGLLEKRIITYLSLHRYDRKKSIAIARITNRFNKNYFLGAKLDSVFKIFNLKPGIVGYLSRQKMLGKKFLKRCSSEMYLRCTFDHSKLYIRQGFEEIRKQELQKEQYLIYKVLKHKNKTSQNFLALQIYFNHLSKYILDLNRISEKIYQAKY